jgi:ASC-1-like (ASCH) protein
MNLWIQPITSFDEWEPAPGTNIEIIYELAKKAISTEVLHCDIIKLSMAEIKKKIQPEYFDAIVSGKKKYEFRVADFDVQEGDTLILEEWDQKVKSYTGRTIVKKVIYIAKFTLDSFGQKEALEKNGFYILSIE